MPYTWTSLKSITLLHVNSIIEYEPNLALCPGLSALPSPASIIDFCLNCDRSTCCWRSHSDEIVGCRYWYWWRKNVLVVIVEHFRMLNILRAWDGKAPAYKMAVDVKMLPAGMLPTKGWLSHKRFLPHFLHHCVIHKKVPAMTFLRLVEALPQKIHEQKRSKFKWGFKHQVSILTFRWRGNRQVSVCSFTGPI